MNSFRSMMPCPKEQMKFPKIHKRKIRNTYIVDQTTRDYKSLSAPE